MSGLLSLTLRALGGRVLVLANGEPVALMAWQAAKEHAVELKRKAQGSADAQVSYILPTDGRAIALDLERSAALQISAALHQAGAMAEEQSDPQRVVDDAALLIRMGAPVGITNDKRIQEAAWNAAQWDPQLRKAPLRGIQSKERVGTPTLIQTKPRTVQ